MSLIYRDALIVLDSTNVSGSSNEVSMDFTRTEHDDTSFGDNAKTRVVGLMDATASVSGVRDAVERDEQLELVEGADLHTIIAPTANMGGPAWAFQSKVLSRSVGGAVDSLLPWNAELASNERSGVKRWTLITPALTTIPAPLAMAGVQIGAVDADQSIHFIAVSMNGEDIDLTIQSNSTNGWSSPTDRGTMSADDGVIATHSVAGPITHTWYRVAVNTVTGPAQLLVIAAIY